MKIPVRYINTSWRIEYRSEYFGFVMSQYDGKRHRWNSALLSGADFWTIDKLERTLNFYIGALDNA